MRFHVAIAAALVLASSAALAQTPPPPPAPEDHGDHPPPDDHKEEGGHGMRAHWGPPSKAARFRIEAGDLSIGMKCPDDEDLKACADFTLQMIDKLGSLQHR